MEKDQGIPKKYNRGPVGIIDGTKLNFLSVIILVNKKNCREPEH